MVNPMLTQLNQGKMKYLLENITGIKKNVEMLKSLGSPEKALESLMQKSPQMKEAIDYVNAHGGDPKEVCYTLLKNNGIDPQELENALR